MSKIFQRKAGGSFYIRIYKGGGERLLSLRTNARREAEKRAGRILYSNLPAILQAAVDRPRTSLSQLWDEFVKSKAFTSLKPSSAKEKTMIWKEFSKDIKVKDADDVTTSRIVEWVEGVSKASSPSTARIKRSHISSVWRAVAHKFSGLPDPWVNLPRIDGDGQEKHTGTFSRKQIGDILEALSKRNDNWRAMVMIALHTGLRLTDVVHLRHEMAQDGVLSLTPRKTERKARPVHIPIHPDIRRFFNKGEGFLWEGEVKAYKANRQQHSQQFKRILGTIGIHSEGKSRIGFHSLRATFISALERAGVERRGIQSAVGHRSGEQTGKYSDLTLTDGDIAKLDYGS